MADRSVELRLYASLQKWRPGSALRCVLSGVATVADLARKHGVPEHEIAIIMINGRRASLDTALADGDTVQLFPLIGGG